MKLHSKMYQRLFSKLVTSGFSRTVRQTVRQLDVSRSRNIPTSQIHRSEAEIKTNYLQFNETETEEILKVLNEKTANDLMRYDISKGRALKIQAWKERNGSFGTLDDIFNIDGFGLKLLDKFFKSLLNTNVEKLATAKKQQSFTVPVVSPSFREEFNSCVAIRVGVSSVTWSRLELQEQHTALTHWEHHDILEKKLHLNDLIQRSSYLDYLIPEADCYVFENPQVAQPGAPGSADQVNINVQRSQLLATLGFAVSNRQKNAEIDGIQKHPNVYYLRRFLTSRLFNTLVGTERVSTEDNIRRLMNDTHEYLYDKDEESLDANEAEISLQGELRNMYRNSEAYQKEYLGQSLLLGLAFLRLSIVQCPRSLASVSRGGRNKPKE